MKKNKLRWQVVVFTLIRLVLNTVFRMVYPFRGEFEKGLGVSYAQMSRGLGLRSFLGLFAPLLAVVGDRRGRRTGILFGLAVYVVGLGVVIFWPTFPGFILALVITTLGKFTYDPSVQAYIGDRVAYERRARVLAVFEYSWSLSYLIGGLVVGALIARYGWVSPFVLVGVLALAGILVLRWMLPKEPPQKEVQTALLGNFREVFASPTAVIAMVMVLFVGLANEMINLEFGPWLQDNFGLKLLALGGASAALGLSELVGEGVVTLVVDRLGKQRAVGLGLLANIIAGGLLPIMDANVGLAVFGLTLFYFSFEFTFVSIVPLISEILPKARGTMLAFMFASISLGRVLGAWINPGLHQAGFWASAAATVVFNLCAIAALSRVKMGAAGQVDPPGSWTG
ncbi:MAG: MFS transporter [Chloroflexota bacterium]